MNSQTILKLPSAYSLKKKSTTISRIICINATTRQQRCTLYSTISLKNAGFAKSQELRKRLYTENVIEIKANVKNTIIKNAIVKKAIIISNLFETPL